MIGKYELDKKCHSELMNNEMTPLLFNSLDIFKFHLYFYRLTEILIGNF